MILIGFECVGLELSHVEFSLISCWVLSETLVEMFNMSKTGQLMK